MNKADLKQKYTNTTYWVETDDRYLPIRVGRPNPELDEFLLARHYHSWAYITPFNPGSVMLTPPENKERLHDLGQEVCCFTMSYDGWGVADDGAWPPEESLLIVDISEDQACKYGVKYGQNAIVVGTIGSPARLIDLQGNTDRDHS